jgi:hypothetical protein
MSLKATRRLIYSLVILLACTMLTSAQDAGQVLRLSVGFNSLKNTLKAENKLSGDKLAEIERLSELAKQANAAGRYGEALKHMYSRHRLDARPGVDAAARAWPGRSPLKPRPRHA